LSRIRIRLLGGFEVWDGDRQIGGFESQKARALLAYLISGRRRSFSRDHLAGLLWPEREPESARHALRQAFYNLRSKLPEGTGLLVGNQQEIGFNPDAECWLDVEAFESAMRRGTERATDPHYLSMAAQLYRGEFLAGFFVKDSQAFEDWMIAEQVRLRDAAVEVLRKLIESYRRRGEYRFAAHYARRLVAIEPLSEGAHRELMRLSALSGQRSRALAQFEELVNLLREELGVEPLAETRALYESILAEAVEEETAKRATEPIGPMIPLAGRGVVEGQGFAVPGGAGAALLGLRRRRLRQDAAGQVVPRRHHLQAAHHGAQGTLLRSRAADRLPALPGDPAGSAGGRGRSGRERPRQPAGRGVGRSDAAGA
jgi:DNA-binding SARP family transcriptional activator